MPLAAALPESIRSTSSTRARGSNVAWSSWMPPASSLEKSRNIVDHAQQALAGEHDGVDELLLLGVERRVPEEGGHPQHPAERRPQLVGDGRQELGLDAERALGDPPGALGLAARQLGELAGALGLEDLPVEVRVLRRQLGEERRLTVQRVRYHLADGRPGGAEGAPDRAGREAEELLGVGFNLVHRAGFLLHWCENGGPAASLSGRLHPGRRLPQSGARSRERRAGAPRGAVRTPGSGREGRWRRSCVRIAVPDRRMVT